MGTYVKIALKQKNELFAKKANQSLKRAGISYQFYTEGDLKTDVEYINSPEGVEQQHCYENGIATPEEFLKKWFAFIRLYFLIVKNNHDDLEPLYKWVQTTGKKYVSLKESEELPFKKEYSPIKHCPRNPFITNPIKTSVKRHRELRGCDVPLVRMQGKVYEVSWGLYHQLED